MIYLLHGKDDYRIGRRVREIRAAALGGDEVMADSNVSRLEGRGLTPGELVAQATASPFLAAARVVIVEGLVAALALERRGRAKKGEDDPLAAWRAAAVTLGDVATMPATTSLLFVEGDVAKNSAAFGIFANISKAEEFEALKGGELAEEIRRLAEEQGANLSARAMAGMVQVSGGDLRAVSSELAKLATYANGEQIDVDTLEAAGSLAQETKVWELTDAIVAGDERKALGAAERLRDAGEPAPLVQFMITRQFRQLVIVKDMAERGTRPDEIARASGIPSFRMVAVRGVASRFTWQALRAAYQRVLEADLNVKRGLVRDEDALTLLISQLCELAPRSAAGRRR